MNYYILKDNDIIKAGDEWCVGGSWERCTNSVGQKNIDYRLQDLPAWQVRRPIKKTKLGNIL